MNENQNLFVIKSFFRVIHFLIVKNWAYTHNFKDLVDLISQCGGMEVRKHLDFGPRNAQYTSPEYVGKFVTVINDYIELPLLASLRSKCFTFYNDESQDITSTEQMAIYGSFEHNKKVSEHFIGIYPISKLVGTKLSAENIMHSLKKYFEDASINIKQARFACMDTTNVNSGKKGGLKRYLANEVPLLNWVGCGNHKLALCFKHLLPKYPTVFATDAFLEALWKFFKYRPLAMNLLDQSANIYGEKVVVPVCPSVTRWTAHERACLSVVRGYRQFVSSLVVCYNERREPEALGLLMQLCKPDIVATILMLLEVFKSTGPLNLILQKGDGSLCLAEIPALLEISIHQLSTSKDDRKWLKEDTFLEMKNVAEEEIVNLPVASRLRESVVFDWSTFESKIFFPFVDEFILEIQEAFKQLEFWVKFSIFDPRNLPDTKVQLASYGNNELESLISHYGNSKSDTFKGVTVTQEPDIAPAAALAEWDGFKLLMFLKRQSHEELIDTKIAAVKNPGKEGKDEVESLYKMRKKFTPQLLWELFAKDSTTEALYPSMMFLFYMLLIFPVSAACVERLFSKMKLIKTRLRNQLSQVRLDQLLRIATETPKDGYSDDVYEQFAHELKRRYPKMKIDL